MIKIVPSICQSCSGTGGVYSKDDVYCEGCPESDRTGCGGPHSNPECDILHHKCKECGGTGLLGVAGAPVVFVDKLAPYRHEITPEDEEAYEKIIEERKKERREDRLRMRGKLPPKEEHTVTISKEEHERLQADSLLLETLRSFGVDNWEGYDEARRQLRQAGYKKHTEEETENTCVI